MLTLLVIIATSGAADRPLAADVNGDAKSFFFATFPYDHLLFVDDYTDLGLNEKPEADPSGQSLVDGRLKLEVRGWDMLKLQLHGTVTGAAPGGFSSAGTSFVRTGAGAPQAVDLTWSAVSGSGLDVWTRVDRAMVTAALPGLDITVGRQPITFGRAMFFTPLDLVAPFSPTVVDQEYKPGIDAVRVDGYPGTSTQVTAVAAYGATNPGDWSLDHLILSGLAQTTLGVWDVGIFAGSVHRDGVFGLSVAGSAGPVGLHTEGSITLPSEDSGDAPYVRGVVGATHMFGDTSLAGEVYYQGVGAESSDEYLVQASGDRYARGELWAMGRWYTGLSLSHQLYPRLGTGLFAIANLADPSLMIGPNLAWSVGDNSTVAMGGYVGVGERPGDVTLNDLVAAGLGADSTEADLLSAIPINSEFGLVPVTAFLQWKAYF